MSTARVSWIATAVTSVMLGTAGLFLTPPLAAFSGFGVGAFAGALLHGTAPVGTARRLMLLRAQRFTRPPSPTGSVLTGAGGGLVVTGLFSLLGAGALTMLALLGISGVVILRSPGEHRTSASGPPEMASNDVCGGRDSTPRGQLPARRTDAQSAEPASADWAIDRLCRMWQSSYASLVDARDAGDHAAIVRLAQARRSYLDELECRHPAGFAAWMASGARAAGDPRRHLKRPAPDAADGQRDSGRPTGSASA